MRQHIYFFVYFIGLNIFFLSFAQAQNSYILRNTSSLPASMPPMPPSIKPFAKEVKKKAIPTNNPPIEAAKSSTKEVGSRDNVPNIAHTKPQTQVPKKVEDKQKTKQETTINTPKNTGTNSSTVATPKKESSLTTSSSTSLPAPAKNPNMPTPPQKNNIPPKTATNDNAPIKTNPTPTTTEIKTPLADAPKANTSPVIPKDNAASTTVSAEEALKNAKALRVAVDTARAFIGTKYLTGGMSREGMDCSGLINVAFKAIGKKIPRTSRDLSEFGVEIKAFPEIKVGDLLFFDSNDSKRINHVGMVIRVTPEQIWFIHATCSKGVREDKLIEGYWTSKHRKSMRILPN